MSRSSALPNQSLSEKLRVFCEYADVDKMPEGFADFVASPAPGEYGVGFIRSLAKEVDTWIRELMTPDQQDEIVRKMRAAGVYESDLPNTDRTRAVRRLLKLKRPPRANELQVIRLAATDWQGLSLSAAEVSSLKTMVK